ncbi:hypothetical protein DI09_21p10 [Mitosporidium daphniae]|uniref:RING-type E3 ubiquitin transferase n=1 Tax=Mitosporidium daphniae TaxID=1485682 RepID=A0A098VT90_9MICR|nr:uncharacterized protein DI09_21p10 [Mitosporidium daphniae]KGG52029.1 hypothetical protein DI09_21p10 [Mitosporidium daphniae]|eukprot:XP_013238486.1 uncharacterized protein DI09_21p10 [Mitosporidium daphniae]
MKEPLAFVIAFFSDNLLSTCMQWDGHSPFAKEKPQQVIFYSISAPHKGLTGLSLGSTLLKEVTHQLERNYPSVKRLITFSPIPGFVKWLKEQEDELENKISCYAVPLGFLFDLKLLLSCTPITKERLQAFIEPYQKEDLQFLFKRLIYRYIVGARRNNRCIDPVANFHLGNGAIFWDIVVLGDFRLMGDSNWTVISRDRNTSDQHAGGNTNVSSKHSNGIIPLPCKFYLLGSCTAGKSCKYLHFKNKELKNHLELSKGNGQNIPNTPLVCTYYQKGSCKYGSKCIFLHTKSSNSLPSPLLKSEKDTIAAIKLDNDEFFENSKNSVKSDPISTTTDACFEDHSYEGKLFDEPDEAQLFELELQEQRSLFFSRSSIGSFDLRAENEPATFSQQEIACFPYPKIGGQELPLESKKKYPSASYSSALKSSLPIKTNAKMYSSADSLKGGHRHTINMNGKLDQICPGSETATCTLGDRCIYYHGLKCPHCFLFILHPSDSRARELHISQCKDTCGDKLDANLFEHSLADSKTCELECGICLEPLPVNGITKFGLLNCNHPFCLECIRSWRASQNVDSSICRSCPICRVNTHFITPSLIWCADQAQKSLVIENYKNKLRSIPCRHFRQGATPCPFGSSCFYAHLGRDGKPIESSRTRTYMNESEEILVVTNAK